MALPDWIAVFIAPLDHLGIDHMVTGSVGAMAYGEPRMTTDVDIVLRLESDQVGPLLAFFPEDAFYRPPEDVVRHEIGRPTRTQRGREGLLGITLDDYLQLVDLTGRHARAGKRGAIPMGLEPILSRLEFDVERWVTEMLRHGKRIGRAIGSASSLASEAKRRGTKWVVNACRVYQAAGSVR